MSVANVERHDKTEGTMSRVALIVSLLFEGTFAVALTPSVSPPESSPRSSPLARGYHVMVGLGANGGVLLFGGETAGPKVGGRVIADPWAFRGGKWVALNRDVPPALGSIAAYDAQSQRAIVLTEVGVGFAEYVEMILFDPTNDRWDKRPLRGGPSRQHGARAAYHKKADRMVILDDSAATWTYDLDANAWTNRMPATSPPRRQFGVMAYDESSDRVILHGGYGGGSDRTDTWAYDLSANTWTELNPSASPPSRKYAAMAYDPINERMVLFGGAVGPFLQETALGDTWTYSYKTNTWTEVPTRGAPTTRGWHAMAYDGATAKILLFGGGKDRRSFLGDTWTFDPRTDSWSSMP